MGKRLRAQRRGKGSLKYRAPSNRYKYDISYPQEKRSGVVKNILNDPARSGVILQVSYDSGGKGYILAPEGVRVGQRILVGEGRCEIGNILALGDIPEGVPIYNLEVKPGDGGKLVRSAGTYATVVSHEEGKTVVQLPSKQMRVFQGGCRATIGVVSGGGRKEKPLLKSGKKFHILRSKAASHIHVSGVSMNPVDHPFGGGQHDRIGKSKTISKKAPTGRKVGLVGAKRTGRK
ncbi:MAG: 50S ribosomal protein L2 [Candidatus Methanofastidiosia archaeon]